MRQAWSVYSVGIFHSHNQEEAATTIITIITINGKDKRMHVKFRCEGRTSRAWPVERQKMMGMGAWTLGYSLVGEFSDWPLPAWKPETQLAKMREPKLKGRRGPLASCHGRLGHAARNRLSIPGDHFPGDWRA